MNFKISGFLVMSSTTNRIGYMATSIKVVTIRKKCNRLLDSDKFRIGD